MLPTLLKFWEEAALNSKESTLDMLYRVAEKTPPTQRAKALRPTLNELRKNTAARICAAARQGWTQTRIADSMGITVSGFTHMAQRGFSASIDSLETLCDCFLCCSCSELLFGSSQIVITPMELQMFLDSFELLTKEKRVCVLNDMHANVQTSNPLSSSEVVYKRICQIADDKGVLAESLFEAKECSEMKAAFRKMLDEKKFVGHVSTFMYFCIVLKVSPDYLLRQDYSRYCGKYKKDGTLSMLSASEQKTASLFLRQDYDKQCQTLAKTIVYALNCA